MWSAEQQRRIAADVELARKRFGDIQLRGWGEDTCLSTTVRTDVDGHPYRLQVYLPPHFPHQKPDLCVEEPEVLWMHGGKRTLNELGRAGKFHLLDNPRNRLLRICHTPSWVPTVSCEQVLVKGVLWLNAYDLHFETGEPIAAILRRVHDRLSATFGQELFMRCPPLSFVQWH